MPRGLKERGRYRPSDPHLLSPRWRRRDIPKEEHRRHRRRSCERTHCPSIVSENTKHPSTPVSSPTAARPTVSHPAFSQAVVKHQTAIVPPPVPPVQIVLTLPPETQPHISECCFDAGQSYEGAPFHTDPKAFAFEFVLTSTSKDPWWTPDVEKSKDRLRRQLREGRGGERLVLHLGRHTMKIQEDRQDIKKPEEKYLGEKRHGEDSEHERRKRRRLE